MRRRLAARLTLLPLLALLLCGCLVPDHYIGRVKVERDGTYKVFAEGLAVHVESVRALRALEAEQRSGALKPEDAKKRKGEIEGRLKAELETLRKDPRVQGLNSVGEGKVRFTVGGTWTIDRSVLVFSELAQPVAYAIAPDGTIRLRVKDAIPPREAKSLGLKTEGNLSVVLAEGIEVLEHNAQIVPKSPAGAYRWTISGPDDPLPYLKIRLPGTEPAETPPAPKKGLVGHKEKR